MREKHVHEFVKKAKQLHSRHHPEFEHCPRNPFGFAHDHRKYREFDQYHKRLKYFRPFTLIFNLVILYLLFKWIGVHVITIFFAAVISIKEIAQLYFFWRLERRIMQPIGKLKDGVEEIAKGNYAINIASDVNNEIGLLITSFNVMAQKLQESERLKAEYEENRKTLLANITHDLKTPLASIQGYLEAIADRVVKSPAEIEKYLKIIMSNTAYVNKLIDDLFLFSKLDLEKVEFKLEEVHVALYMADLLEELKLELAEKGHSFAYTKQMEDDCIVKIDGKRIYQAIRNIIGNAVKYGPAADLLIEARLYQEGDFVCIDLQDNGPGIPADKLPYIFDRFYRIDTERTKDLMSTGLGLAIAREVVLAHGGKITVSSVENEGSCFTVSLPIAKCQGDEV